MIKTYKAAAAAWVETPPKIYDTATASRIEAPSAKTYDAPTASWVEHLDLYNYFRLLTYSFNSGQGGYIRSDDDKTVTFRFAQGNVGMDSAAIVWEGEEVTGSVFMGEYYSSSDTLNPDVYFYYKGEQVLATKLRSQEGTLFGIPYSGSVDMIVVNIVPYSPCEFRLIRPWFGKSFKFDF